MNTEDINLLKQRSSQTFLPPGTEELLHRLAIWGLVVLLASGVFLGFFFALLTSRVQQLQAANDQYRSQINAASVKESLLLSLRQRIVIAGKALEAARPWGNLFPILAQIAQQSEFINISVDESGKVNATVLVASVNDAVRVVSNTIALTDVPSLRAPQLTSFAVQADGSVRLGLSFIPILL